MVVMGDFIGAGGAKAPFDPHLPREQINKAVSGLLVRHSIVYVVVFEPTCAICTEGSYALLSVCLHPRALVSFSVCLNTHLLASFFLLAIANKKKISVFKS